MLKTIQEFDKLDITNIKNESSKLDSFKKAYIAPVLQKFVISYLISRFAVTTFFVSKIVIK